MHSGQAISKMSKSVDFRPLGDRLLVRLDGDLGMTSGGLHTPGNATRLIETGTVVACGPGRQLETGKYAHMGVGVGDRVMFLMRGAQVSAMEVRVNGEKFYLITLAMVVGVVGAGVTRDAVVLVG